MEPFDSPEEAAFRAKARDWLEANARRYDRPQVATSAIVVEWSPEEEERKLAEAQEWQRTKFDAGWAGISWPTEYGGRGGTLMEQLIFRQEEAEFDVPQDALEVGLGWCGPAVMAHGTQELKDALLRPLLRGDEVWCQLFSEPAAGSDLAGLQTKAMRDGDEWVLSGQKVWTTFAHRSHWGLCVARHDADVPKHRGLTAFILDMSTPGVECRPLRQMTDSNNFNEVFLDGVRVPDSHRVGDVGDGWRLVITTFMYERMSPSFAAGGVVHALMELLRAEGVADDPVTRDRFADIYARGRALQFTGMRLLTDISKGRAPGPQGSILKLSGTTLLTDIYELAVEVLGHKALALDGSRDSEWIEAFLGAPGLRIGGGTDQIQRNIIGERVLGLPGDIRVDKEVPFSAVPRS